MNRLAVLVGAVLMWCSSAVQAQNLVQNPGFESGLAGWTTDSPGGALSYWFASSTPRSGSGSAGTGCVGSACITTEPSAEGAWLYQDVPTAPGATYTISFWYRAFGTAVGDYELQVFFGPVAASSSNPGTCIGNCIFDTQGNTNDWVQVTRTVVAASTSTRLQFLGRNDPSGTYVDDVSVTLAALPASAVPTLSQWGVLTLGLLLALSTGWVLRRRPR